VPSGVAFGHCVFGYRECFNFISLLLIPSFQRLKAILQTKETISTLKEVNMFFVSMLHSNSNDVRTHKKALPFILLLALAVLAGCGGSKVQTLPTPEPEQTEVREPEPVAPAKPQPETKAVVEESPAVPFVLQNVYFDFDKYDLTSNALQTLADNARVLKAYPDAHIVIEGHCDERGTVEYNLALGDKRAKAAKDYLVSLGVNASQVSTISYGKEQPVDPSHTEAAWAKNRRAEFERR
jgi:peptidoglycan-associated lipoprotein